MPPWTGWPRGYVGARHDDPPTLPLLTEASFGHKGTDGGRFTSPTPLDRLRLTTGSR